MMRLTNVSTTIATSTDRSMPTPPKLGLGSIWQQRRDDEYPDIERDQEMD
jgi:hypothetical protein